MKAQPGNMSLRVGLAPMGSSLSWRIREISKLYTSAFSESVAARGLTHGQWRCLRVLWEQDGMSQRSLSEALDMTPAAAVFSVNLLERDGLAQRVGDPSDKRRTFVHLTRKGRRLLERLLPECGDLNVRISAPFTDRELQTLSDLLDKLKLSLEEELVLQSRAAPRAIHA
jgi:DNA-binding MarR family transcriptional regulator